MNEHLRPLERTILKRAEEGMPVSEIAWRLRRSPGSVERILELTQLDREASQFTSDEGGLRPLERRVLSARRSGTATAEIASRLRKSPSLIDRIEDYANYKLSR